jgi:Helix-turn-helix domain
VAWGYRLQGCDTLEFIVPWGRKGATENRDDYFLNTNDSLLKLNEIIYRLGRLEAQFAEIAKQQAPSKEFYTVEEFANLVDLSSYTVREHCRLGRLNAVKSQGGRGNVPEWRIPHDELVRFRNHGLLPFRKNGG